MKTYRVLLTLLIGLAVQILQLSGAEPPTPTTLAALLASPESFSGKTVIVHARLGGVCGGDGCLILKDKLDVVEGVPEPGLVLPRLRAGQSVSVTGSVQVRHVGQGESVVSLAVSKVKSL